MEAKAVAKYVRIAPRKVRVVMDLIRGKSVAEAFAILKFTPKVGAEAIEKVLKSAVANGTMYGAVTQSPLVMGITTVDVLCDAAAGKSVSDVPTDGYWYNADNMEDPEIAPNLYD